MQDASVKSHRELRNLIWNAVLLFQNIEYFEQMISNVLEYFFMDIISKNQFLPELFVKMPDMYWDNDLVYIFGDYTLEMQWIISHICVIFSDLYIILPLMAEFSLLPPSKKTELDCSILVIVM